MALSEFFITFYLNEGRTFPWRYSRTPFKVYLSEVMLQRTRADQVLPIFNVLIRRFPDVHSLYKGFEEAKKMVNSLGRSARFLYVERGLRYLLDKYDGQFPVSKEDLLQVPSIGEYTAAAIRVFAFHLKDTIIDCNIVRVLSRVHGISSNDEMRRNKSFSAFADQLVPDVGYVEYSYGLLDFASTVCLSRRPRCSVCQIRVACLYSLKQIENVAESGLAHPYA